MFKNIAVLVPPLLFLSASVSACTATPDFSPLEFDLGVITIDRNRPIGSSIKTKLINTDRTSLIECNTATIMRYNSPVTFTSVYLDNGTATYYDTNVQGVAVGFSAYQQNSIGGTIQQFKLPSDTAALSYNGPFHVLGGMVALIKSNDYVAGGVINAPIAAISYDEGGASGAITRHILLKAIIESPSCDIIDDAIYVKLDQANAGDFLGPGSTAKPKSFSIDLMCPSGMPVKIQLDSANAQMNGILEIHTSPDAAQGIGIQLLDSYGVPVDFGLEKNVGTTTSEGEYNIHFTARYYQTARTVMAGLAQATVNFTMSYN
jgi:type 1 fimbria pilin